VKMDDFPLEHIYKEFDYSSDAWESKAVRNELANITANWIYGLREWNTFITLTFKNETALDTANKLFIRLISILNEECFGKHYTRLVKHSYFSYVQGIEYQKRDVIHFHVLIDRPVNFQRIHKLWNAWAGFVWTEIVMDQYKVTRYVSKYICKGGEINVYLADKRYMPIVKPHWWKEDMEMVETIIESKS
jgi:hypothetical protein